MQKTLEFGMGNSDLEKNFVTANDNCVQDKAKFPDEPILINQCSGSVTFCLWASVPKASVTFRIQKKIFPTFFNVLINEI
jgi:hypothetical protein